MFKLFEKIVKTGKNWVKKIIKKNQKLVGSWPDPS